MEWTPKQYAQALYKILENTDSKYTNQVIDTFSKTVAENNDLDKIDSIIENFQKIWDGEKGIIEAKVVSVHELNEGLIEVLKDYIKTITGASEVYIIQKIDENILGGVVIKYKDKILDASLKRDLENLRKQMKK